MLYDSVLHRKKFFAIPPQHHRKAPSAAQKKHKICRFCAKTAEKQAKRTTTHYILRFYIPLNHPFHQKISTPKPRRIPHVPAPAVLRLFTGCSTVFIVKQPVNSRRTVGAGTKEGRPDNRIAQRTKVRS